MKPAVVLLLFLFLCIFTPSHTLAIFSVFLLVCLACRSHCLISSTKCFVVCICWEHWESSTTALWTPLTFPPSGNYSPDIIHPPFTVGSTSLPSLRTHHIHVYCVCLADTFFGNIKTNYDISLAHCPASAFPCQCIVTYSNCLVISMNSVTTLYKVDPVLVFFSGLKDFLGQFKLLVCCKRNILTFGLLLICFLTDWWEILPCLKLCAFVLSLHTLTNTATEVLHNYLSAFQLCQSSVHRKRGDATNQQSFTVMACQLLASQQRQLFFWWTWFAVSWRICLLQCHVYY